MAAHEGFGPALEVRREVGSWPLWPVGNTGECGSGAPRGLLGGRGWHGSFPCRRRCRCRSECKRGPRRGTWLVLAQNYVTAVTSPSGGMAGCLPETEKRGPRAESRLQGALSPHAPTVEATAVPASRRSPGRGLHQAGWERRAPAPALHAAIGEPAVGPGVRPCLQSTVGGPQRPQVWGCWPPLPYGFYSRGSHMS